MKYYVDNQKGCDGNDGLSPERAVKDIGVLSVKPGDSVLFCRGRTFFGRMPAVSGEVGAPVYYGAYGSGAKPRISGAQELTGTWARGSGNVWKYEGELVSEPGNVIFEDGAECGKLCFTPDEMRGQGDWYFPYAVKHGPIEDKSAALYMWSDTNPAEKYKKIECAVRSDYCLMGAKKNLVLENLAFYGNAVHAFQTCNAVNISIRYCDFDFIGGAVWSLQDRYATATPSSFGTGRKTSKFAAANLTIFTILPPQHRGAGRLGRLTLLSRTMFSAGTGWRPMRCAILCPRGLLFREHMRNRRRRVFFAV
jgi:hypothetical protein